MPGIMIAGTHSGCGKTTITLGLLAALKKKGLTVQAFKTGPDFIDSGLHRLITARACRNLDLWMCGEDYVRECFQKNASSADLAVIEGVMGLYDGSLSSADLACVLNVPVLLVVDAYGLAESAGAVVRGFTEYQKHLSQNHRQGKGLSINFLGVIFNRVASANHYQRLKKSIFDLPVLGYLPRDIDFEIPHRHLGLKVAEEKPMQEDAINKLAEVVLNFIDVEALINSLGKQIKEPMPAKSPSLPITLSQPLTKTIAVAYDQAFCFYYQDNLDLLSAQGARLVWFSPLCDPAIPGQAEAVYLGGGYPELYAGQLSQNYSMLASIKEWAFSGQPIYAECGGLMYLSQGIYDFEANFFPMAGVFPFNTRMKKRKARLGYREIMLKEDCLLGQKGERLRGHEFHYSEIEEKPDGENPVGEERPVGKECRDNQPVKKIYSLKDNYGQEIGSEGFRFKNSLASYVHVHFGSHPGLAAEFISSGK